MSLFFENDHFESEKKPCIPHKVNYSSHRPQMSPLVTKRREAKACRKLQYQAERGSLQQLKLKVMDSKLSLTVDEDQSTQVSQKPRMVRPPTKF